MKKQRAGAKQEKKSGGYEPAANRTEGMDLEKLRDIYRDRVHKQEATPQPQGQWYNIPGSQISDPLMQNASVFYASPLTTTSGTSMMSMSPKITYSATTGSKSYTPSQVTLGKSSVSGPVARLG